MAQAELPENVKLIVGELTALSWTRVEELDDSMSKALEICRKHTCPGGLNDPSREESSSVWLWLVDAAKKAGTLSRRVAREWYLHLNSVDRVRRDFSRNRGVAAYTAGVIELHRNNVAAARRWLHVAAVEDYRAGHRGAARAALLASLGESVESLDALEILVKAAPPKPGGLAAEAEFLLTRWYLERDIRTSDMSLDAEHELDPGLLRLFLDHINGTFSSTTEQGKALEELAAYVLGHVAGCYPVRNVSTIDFETDLVVRNLARAAMPALDVLGRYFLVECKNWASPVGASAAAYFANRIRYCRAHTGLLFAKNGITGEGREAVGDARFTLHRSFSHDGIVVAVVSAADLEGLAHRKETPLQLLLRKHDEVRFGARPK